MWNFFSVVAVCMTAMYFLHRLLPQLAKRAAAVEVLPSIDEFKYAESASATAEPIPFDLANLALKESEGWAQQAALKSMHELYDQLGDWNKVRAVWRPYPDPEEIA